MISILIQRECHHSGKFHCSNKFNGCTVAMMVKRRPSLKLSKVFEVNIIWSVESLLDQTTKAPPRGAINSRILICSVSTIFHSISITADVSMSMMNILWCVLHCQIFIGRFFKWWLVRQTWFLIIRVGLSGSSSRHIDWKLFKVAGRIMLFLKNWMIHLIFIIWAALLLWMIMSL